MRLIGRSSRFSVVSAELLLDVGFFMVEVMFCDVGIVMVLAFEFLTLLQSGFFMASRGDIGLC